MTTELRIQLKDDDPDAELLKWFKEQKDGRRLILNAARAYWLASCHHDCGKLTEQTVWLALNALSYQFNFVAQSFGHNISVNLLPLSQSKLESDQPGPPPRPVNTPQTQPATSSAKQEARKLLDQAFS